MRKEGPYLCSEFVDWLTNIVLASPVILVAIQVQLF
jgi:hypothetical protein